MLFLLCITYDKWVQFCIINTKNAEIDVMSILEPEWIFYELLYEALFEISLYVLVVLASQVLKKIFWARHENMGTTKKFSILNIIGISTMGFYGIDF